ncbi:MAG: MFS transporter, partial [Candidatus Dormibacteria bacterium]
NSSGGALGGGLGGLVSQTSPEAALLLSGVFTLGGAAAALAIPRAGSGPALCARANEPIGEGGR